MVRRFTDSRINQGRFIELVAAESGVSREDTMRVMRAVFDIIGRTVAGGGSVAITNFGTWTSRVTPAGMRRNPQTGGKVRVPDRRRPVFRWAPAVKRATRTGEVPQTFRKKWSR
jgi:DNA-binding protein HU-beta